MSFVGDPFRRLRIIQAITTAAIAKAAPPTPAPIPAFAPVERPEDDPPVDVARRLVVVAEPLLPAVDADLDVDVLETNSTEVGFDAVATAVLVGV